ncbi:MAG TPA: error-prone DNA polymerase [Pirellulales bacterium]|nr:error-prone DNA polymerase [Pirellulales bacterium]
MPEQPDSNRRQLADTPPVSPVPRQTVVSYAELHCKTNFSFLEGASHPDELVYRAAELGYSALAITDRNSLAGVVRAWGAAKQAKLKLLIGAELTPIDAPPLVVLATDRKAYGRLSRLITVGRRNAPKGQCRLTLDDIAAHAEGLLGLVVGTITDSTEWHPAFLQQLSRYREIFADRCYLLAELHRGPNDDRVLEERIHLAQKARLPLVAANDVHFHHPSRRALADVLASTRAGCTVAEAGELLFPNAARHLKSPEEMRELFARVPAAVRRSVEVAERCTFVLDELRYEYPEELAPAGQTPLEYLTRLTWEGAGNRYPGGVPEKVRKLLEHELRLIAELRYEAYFLTVWDLVMFARSREILCQGRGSAANSAVCFCLGVTSVDPERMDVLFERFISRERNEAPDIDVDFEHERREEVIQYVYQKYGRERAGMTAEVITYRPRSAARDVGKALGLSLDRVDALCKTLDNHGRLPAERCAAAGIDPQSPIGRQLLGLVGELLGFPRHLGQHVGGLVITEGPLCEIVPIENAAMEDRTVIEWDKDDLDELGILKVDCLSLGMLTAIHKCFDLIEQHYQPVEKGDGHLAAMHKPQQHSAVARSQSPFSTYQPVEKGDGHLAATHKPQQHPSVARSPSPFSTGRRLTLADIPEGDAEVYGMICRADTMGVFQIESRAQMSMLPRLQPNRFYDLVIEVAIVRPGPIQGDMVHPYLRRRAGEEPIEYPNDAIRAVLEKTLGVPLFQEQAMQLAVVAAGFTPGEADQLRRAMAAWRRPGVIDGFRVKLLEGMRARGLSEEFAERLFKQIRGFGEYGFPESHAASFALLAYVSAWLKFHYPAAFCAALINSQPMGFYAPAQLVRNAIEHGVEVRPIDVNHSRWDCTLEDEEDRGQGAGIRGQELEDARVARSASDDATLARSASEGALGNAQNSQESRRVPLALPVPCVERDRAKCTGGTSGTQAQSASVEPAPPPSALTDCACQWQTEKAIRLGLRMVVGLPQAQALLIEAARDGKPAPATLASGPRHLCSAPFFFATRSSKGTVPFCSADSAKGDSPRSADSAKGDGPPAPFRSIDDFSRRSGVRPSVVERLARADAFESMKLNRRASLWQALRPAHAKETFPLFDKLADSEPPLALPAMDGRQEVFADYQTAGLSLKSHPIAFFRRELDRLRVVPATKLASLEDGRFVRVAGLVLVRQRPATAKGITFVTLEDETGTANLIVRIDVWERFYTVARTAPAFIAAGRLQNQKGVIHVLVSRLENMNDRVNEIRTHSRDFQ